MSINWLDLVWGERKQGNNDGDCRLAHWTPLYPMYGLFMLEPWRHCSDSLGCRSAHHGASTGQRLPPELQATPHSWWGDMCRVVLADVSVAGSWLHRYQESSSVDPDKSNVVLKPVRAASCFLSFLEGAVTPSVGHFCGLVGGVVLKAWLRACSSPYPLFC